MYVVTLVLCNLSLNLWLFFLLCWIFILSLFIYLKVRATLAQNDCVWEQDVWERGVWKRDREKRQRGAQPTASVCKCPQWRDWAGRSQEPEAWISPRHHSYKSLLHLLLFLSRAATGGCELIKQSGKSNHSTLKSDASIPSSSLTCCTTIPAFCWIAEQVLKLWI